RWVRNGTRSTAQRELTSHRQRRRIPHVIRVWFKSTAQHGDAMSQQRTIECPLGQIHGAVAAAHINSIDLTQKGQSLVSTQFAGAGHKSANILRQTATAKAQSGA